MDVILITNILTMRKRWAILGLAVSPRYLSSIPLQDCRTKLLEGVYWEVKEIYGPRRSPVESKQNTCSSLG